MDAGQVAVEHVAFVERAQIGQTDDRPVVGLPTDLPVDLTVDLPAVGTPHRRRPDARVPPVASMRG